MARKVRLREILVLSPVLLLAFCTTRGGAGLEVASSSVRSATIPPPGCRPARRDHLVRNVDGINGPEARSTGLAITLVDRDGRPVDEPARVAWSWSGSDSTDSGAAVMVRGGRAVVSGLPTDGYVNLDVTARGHFPTSIFVPLHSFNGRQDVVVKAGEPKAAVRLRLVDQEEKPLPLQAVAIVLETGAATDQRWTPKKYASAWRADFLGMADTIREDLIEKEAASSPRHGRIRTWESGSPWRGSMDAHWASYGYRGAFAAWTDGYGDAFTDHQGRLWGPDTNPASTGAPDHPVSAPPPPPEPERGPLLEVPAGRPGCVVLIPSPWVNGTLGSPPGTQPDWALRPGVLGTVAYPAVSPGHVVDLGDVQVDPGALLVAGSVRTRQDPILLGPFGEIECRAPGVKHQTMRLFVPHGAWTRGPDGTYETRFRCHAPVNPDARYRIRFSGGSWMSFEPGQEHLHLETRRPESSREVSSK